MRAPWLYSTVKLDPNLSDTSLTEQLNTMEEARWELFSVYPQQGGGGHTHPDGDSMMLFPGPIVYLFRKRSDPSEGIPF